MANVTPMRRNPAKARKVVNSRGVSLPAPEWTTTGRDAFGNEFRLARPGLALASVIDGYDWREDDDGNRKAVARRAQVWRLETHPALADFTAEQRAALTEFAAAVETAEGSIKVQDFAAIGGGGAAGSRPPSPAALAAAEVVRKCEAALHGKALVVVRSPRYGTRIVNRKALEWPLSDLVRAIAVDGRSRADVCLSVRTRLGLGDANKKVKEVVRIDGLVASAVRDGADILAATLFGRAASDARSRMGRFAQHWDG